MMPTLLNNRYRVLQKLGAGGFGHTFLAEDTYLPSGRRCVIKQLKPVTNDPQAYQQVQDRFQREGAVLEELGEGHNQIPRLYAYFSEAGQFYLVQEWIEGQTLTQKVEQQGSLAEPEVRQILINLLPIVDYIHSYHIIHRDIKPDNMIMRQKDGLPVLIDFGAVKEAVQTAVHAQAGVMPSMVIGTPGFMPPEQGAGRPTYASDLYSLGLSAIFLLTGKLPQQLESDPLTGEFLWRQEVPNLHSNLATVIDRSIRFHSSDRFASAKQMLDALQAESSISEMATVAVAPGVPQGNQRTPASNNSTTAATVAVGQAPARQGSRGKSVIIGLGIAAGLLVTAVAVGLGLKQPSEPISETPTSEQSSSEVSPSPSQSPINISPEASPSPSQPPINKSPEVSPSPSQSPINRSPEASPSPSQSPVTKPPKVSPSQPPVTKPLKVSPSQPPVTKSPEASPSPSQPPVTKSPEVSHSPESENNDNNANPSPKIPAFPPGTQRKAVEFALGKPTKTSRGLWNTRAVLYEEYIPNQISLGYLFDPSSGRLRQTEVSFYQSVGLEQMSETVNKLLNNNASDKVKQGLASVYQRRADNYEFVSGRGDRLKGVIQRNEYDRIYVGIWEADLH
ncbi:MAG: protein kinase [Symploca sp. SIO2E6]|nr:protein kinase [Symploca sp. SIO2E6]